MMKKKYMHWKENKQLKINKEWIVRLALEIYTSLT